MSKSVYPSEASAFDDGYRDARNKRQYAPKWGAKWLKQKYKEGYLMAGGKLPKVEA